MGAPCRRLFQAALARGTAKILLDYAHNPHAMEAIGRTVRSLPVAGRRIGVLAAPGDRREAFELARPGDLVAIFAGHPERCRQQVQDLAARMREEASHPVESLSLAL